MDDRILVHGFGLAGYRSFHGPLRGIGPLTRFNVVAGANNAGKSNILLFAQKVLSTVGGQSFTQHVQVSPLDPLDVPTSVLEDSRLEIAIAVPRDLAREQFAEHTGQTGETINRVLELKCLQPIPGLARDLQPDEDTEHDLLWVHYEATPESQGSGLLSVADRQVREAIAELDNYWNIRYELILRDVFRGGAVDPVDVMRRLLTVLLRPISIPPVATIPATRQIQVSDDSSDDDVLSGRGIIRQLAELASPAHPDLQVSDRKFEAINEFARTVLDNRTVRLRIPHDRSTILVQIDDRTLPLENLGTGIHQVIIIAAAATSLDNTLVCIEEPETHLHPLLQRKLAIYLSLNTTNQYLIATHSAHLLDHENASIFHLTLDSNGSTITGAKKPFELSNICGDLGYRPSDLMQTNCVIWVEGPSDRIYLRKWLELAAQVDETELIEDVHYSIMFYGGKLISHLTVDEDSLEEFIQLRRLNRYSAIIFDSDRTSQQKPLSATKKRIIDEVNRGDELQPGYVWATSCYTAENYIPREMLAGAVGIVHKGATLIDGDHRWGNPLRKVDGGTDFDKIAIAHEVCKRLTKSDLQNFDLKAKLVELDKFIRTANGHERFRS